MVSVGKILCSIRPGTDASCTRNLCYDETLGIGTSSDGKMHVELPHFGYARARAPGPFVIAAAVDLAAGEDVNAVPGVEVGLRLHERVLSRGRERLDCPTTLRRRMMTQFDRGWSDRPVDQQEKK